MTIAWTRTACGLAAALFGSAALADTRVAIGERLRERLEQQRAASAPAGPAEAPLGLRELKVSHQGQRRTVLVYAPRAATGAAALPVVVALHGGGGSAGYMADDERYGLNAKAESAGFLVVYPNGYSRLPGGRFATWNAGGCCGEARDRGIDDVGFLREVVAEVERRYRVDPRRVFATGMSNGGMMAYRLACQAADVFRGVASVAGTDAVADCRPSQPVAVLHLHARDDTHVLYGGGAGQDAFRDPATVMDFPSVPATVERWMQRNRCQGAPQRVLQVAGAWCERYQGCAGDSPVQLCVTEEGGHSWPGAAVTRRGKPPASQALSANDVLWSFFAGLPPR